MNDEIAQVVSEVDDTTAVELLQQVGPLLLADDQLRNLVAAHGPLHGSLANLSRLPASSRREKLTFDRSVWLARLLLAALAAQPRFAPLLARAYGGLRRDRLAGRAVTIPRGLTTEIIRVLACVEEAPPAAPAPSRAPITAGSLDYLADVALGRKPPAAMAPIVHYTMAKPTAARSDTAVPGRAAPVTVPPGGTRRHAARPAPAAPPPPDETRRAWPLLECADAVQIGLPFEVDVGLREDRDPKVGGTGGMTLPACDCTLDVQLIFDPTAFAITDGEAKFTLAVSAREPWPRRTVTMVALGGVGLSEHRDIGAIFSLGGVVRGVATRDIDVVRELVAATKTAAASVGGMDLSDFAAPDESDLTLIIKRGNDTGIGRLVFAACSPHPLPRMAELPSADLGSEPARFVEMLVDIRNQRRTASELYRELKGIGLDTLAPKIPDEIKDALRLVAERVAPKPASVLIVSDDPYVPWELAVIEPRLPGVPAEASPFLGAQVALGRWIWSRGNKPTPHPLRRLWARDKAVVTGVYECVTDFGQLKGAEAEASELVTAWNAHKVDATFGAVEKCLKGTPAADVLHFALHGTYNVTGAGIVLIDRPAEGRIAHPTFLDAHQVASFDFGQFHRTPFVFLNACQVGAATQMLGEYVGMARAFLLAGAAAVVAPLWKIDDEAAHQLAVAFYREALAGTPPAELLRRQRARATEAAAAETPPDGGFANHLAYQFFGHPKFVFVRAERERSTP